MNYWFGCCVVLVLAMVLSLALVPVVKRMAFRFGMIDVPSERRIHKQPIPRCGGIAVILATHIALFFAFYGFGKDLCGSIQSTEWLKIFGCSMVLFVIGLLDDRFQISAWVKLGGQLLVASLMFFFGFSFGSLLGYAIPAFLDYFVTLFWFVLLMNAFNLIDGMDGACAGLGCVSGISIAVLLLFLGQTTDALIILALVGACLGFLRYNFNPASIFLGDCGSLFIGFIIAAVSLKANIKQSVIISLLVPLLTVGVPVFDVMLAVWRRLGRKVLGNMRGDSNCKVFGPDLDHLHHRLLRTGLTQKKAALTLYGIALFLCFLAVYSVVMQGRYLAVLILGLVVVVHVIVREVVNLEMWTTVQVLSEGLRRPRALVRAAIHMVGDFLIFVAAVCFALLLLNFDFSIRYFVFYTILPWSLLHYNGAYFKIWNCATSLDFLRCGLFVGVGNLIAYSLIWLFFGEASFRFFVCNTFFAVFGVVFVRALPNLFSCFCEELGRFWGKSDAGRVLIVGSGDYISLYFKYMAIDRSRLDNSPEIVGVVSSDERLRGLRVCGQKVLGKFEELKELVKDNDVSELLICADLTDHQQREIGDIGKRLDIRVSEFCMSLVNK